VRGVEPELARSDRGNLADIDKVNLKEKRTEPSKEDDGEIRDEVALDKFDLR
jgi:hypothetical protein